MKDNFSKQAKAYAEFRPGYPKELFDFLFEKTSAHQTAWDCGTGNGQVAGVLAEKFEKVFATDISENQITNAIQKENIFYKVEVAENTSFPNNTFDLIVVAQAIHWFDFEKFYAEVNRTIKREGLIAVIGYSLFRMNKEVDAIIDHFYDETLHGYWDPERKYIDDEYQTIPFPFHEVKAPAYDMKYEWSLEEVIGYLNTWSAVQHFIRKKNDTPVDEVEKELKQVWKHDEKNVISFPLLCRIGKMQ